MVLTIIIAFFSIIFLMVSHEFGHFIVAKKCGIKVEEFGVGYPPRIFGKKINGTIYSLNLLPFGAFVKIPGEIGGVEDYQSFSGLAIWKRVLIVLGGVISFWVVAFVLFTIVFNIGVKVPISDESGSLPGAEVRIAEVYKNSPAEISGIKRGDVVKELWVDGSEKQAISKIKDFQDFIAASKGNQVNVAFQRGNQTLETSLVPRMSPPENEGPIGVQLERTVLLIQKYPWYQTPIRGLAYCWEITYKSIEGLFKVLSNLITGKGLPSGAEPAGPLGLFVFLARASELGVGFFLYFIAAIAVLLAISNLLPIPALDGGKLLFLAIEKIRAKAVSPKAEQVTTTIFFFLLISFSIFVTIKFDMPKLFEFIKSGF
jgi:regulator of sigma E protease